MILTCPECSTKYLTQADVIGPNGRTVRCASCQTTWFVSAVTEDKAPPLADAKALEEDLKTAPEIEPQGYDIDDLPDHGMERAASNHSSEPKNEDPIGAPLGAHVMMRDKADAEKLRARMKIIRLIWAIPLVIFLIAAILSYVYRQDVVNKFPQSATFYKMFGLVVKTAGLEIENPIVKTALVDGQTILIVNSAVRNVSTDLQRVPVIKLSLQNRAGENLVEWHVEPEKPRLRPKERLTFASQFPDPPADAVNLVYGFSEEG